MASQILITMDDLETAVRLNAALEAAQFSTTMFSSLDDARGTVRRENPDLVILTGGVHEPHAQQLTALAHDSEISTLVLLEPTDSERAERVSRLHATEVMIKPVSPDDAVATARRLIERRRLQERTGIVGESAAIQEVLVKIEQMAPVSSTVLIQGESGTGKELVAKALHDLSPRRGEAFITVNCARPWPWASSATTSTIGSTSSTSIFPRSASGGAISRCWCAASSASSPGPT